MRVEENLPILRIQVDLKSVGPWYSIDVVTKVKLDVLVHESLLVSYTAAT